MPDLGEIVRLRDEEGLSFQEIAVRLGLSSRDAAARAYTRAKGAAITEAEIPSPTVTPGVKLSTVLDLEPSPFQVPIPRPARVRPGQPTRTVVFTDTHAGFHDQQALEVVYGVIKDVKPHRVIHLGDLVDCYTISKYEKDPNRLTKLQDEIDMARVILHQVAQLAHCWIWPLANAAHSLAKGDPAMEEWVRTEEERLTTALEHILTRLT